MRPERRSHILLSITRSKAKMFEYNVLEEHHIKITRDPAQLLPLSIGLLGDLSAKSVSEIIDDNNLDNLRHDLQFSARFFDAYLHSRLCEELDPYLLLLGSASYYLCGLPGSSLVLAKRIGDECPDLKCLGLENLLLWLLQFDFSIYLDGLEQPYGKCIEGISTWLSHFFKHGNGQENLFENTIELRKTAYDNGTPRQLLFADIISAIVKKRFENSTWTSLPKYSGISTDQWLYALQKEDFIRELWPAQHLLGEQNVFRGKSAIVQMPTSAGKTRAAEIIIRSAFLSNRTSIAVFVAPFRALCHEIRNSFIEAFRNEPVNVDELSDILQTDFDISELTVRNQIIVVTPEKLIYILRHEPQLAEKIGLLIYDEGHQFDSGTRGITYELLLTSLRSLISEGSQTVLISAVISNASDIGKWLSGEGSEVISGTSLTPTFRSLAFASWLDRLGRLEFVAPENIDNQEFFVPRIIEQYDLELKGKERKKRIFPSKDDGQAIALFLGLKLAGNGSVAIFCGRKSTAANLSEKVVDIFDRNVILPKPVSFSDQTEVSRLHYLYDCNLGKKASSTQSAALGIFTHHGNTPHGIRIAVEHSMKEGLAKFVICTSTLAQGVNLPIRYLIVTSVYQGLDRIKIRDFHNLIGRAGRAGMHTEGSIIFADPVVFDKRMALNDKWRWSQVKELMEPSNSEPCVSTLLSLFEPLHSDDRKYTIKMDPLDFVRVYIENEGGLESISEEIVAAHSDKGFTKNGTDRQIEWRMNIIHSIESYLMAQWDESDTGLQEEDIVELAKGTLAFFLSDENNRDQIIELFKHIAKNIDQRVSEPSRRKIFGKTLYGVSTSIDIENWVKENIENIVSCSDGESLLSILWPIVAKNIRNNTFRKCDKPETLKEIALEWIQGKPFFELFEILSGADARLIAATQRRKFQIEHIVDICENAFAYDGTLVIGAVTETIELNEREEQTEIINILQELQKRLKYGLPASGAIPLYELGFSDRLVSMDLESIIQNSPPSKSDVQNQLKQKQDEAFNLLKKYPVYFTERLKNLL